VQKNLLENIAPKLRELNRGGYARVYRKGGKSYKSDLHLLIATILDSLGLDYEKDARLRGSNLGVDFSFGNTVILVERRLREAEKADIIRSGKQCIIVSRSSTRSDRFDSGIRVLQLDELDSERVQTIFLDDPSFNFDYAHILPQTEKCSVMHGHTSSALVEIVGSPKDGMVIDFNVAKPIIRKAIGELDHKLFINDKYVVGGDSARVNLRFRSVHGDFDLKVPRKTTVLLKGEATVENLAEELLERVAREMPSNVRAVGVYVYEGLNKGTHLLAEVHRREGEKQRRRR